MNQVWYRAQETDSHHGGTCHIHTEFEKCQYPDWMKTFPPNLETIASAARWLSVYQCSIALATTTTSKVQIPFLLDNFNLFHFTIIICLVCGQS